MKSVLWLAGALTLGCANPGTTHAPETPRLTADGWGPLRIGMTAQEVEAELGPDSDPEAIGGPDPETCDEWRPARAPEGLLVMIEEGRLTTIWLIRGSPLRTDRGIGLGASAATVRDAYGSALRATPHEYQGPDGEYLTVWTTPVSGAEYVEDPAARGIRYETNEQGIVTKIGAGGPSIQNVEGCA